MCRILAYYQDADDLSHASTFTDLILCSIHFGPDYIHLNDYPPDDPKNATMWHNVRAAEEKGVHIWLMIGGAGGAFEVLFKDFDKYYRMLSDCIMNHPCITGIDLDVEEEVDFLDIQQLVMQIKSDFPGMKLSFAPIATSLVNPAYPGMGGFCYADVEKTMGKHIDEYHVQMYDSFNTMTLGYILRYFGPQRIVVGMNGNQNMEVACTQIQDMVRLTRRRLGGVFVWNFHTI